MKNENRSRISEFGEVFTSEREVTAMLNLVDNETHRIDSRFLEPACGDGNFLYEILSRKLAVVKNRYSRNDVEFKKYLFVAVASIYGVDILEDNVLACRKRLLNLSKSVSKGITSDKTANKFFDVIEFVLSKNIIHGDALSLNYANSTQPIVFSEWCLASGSMVKRTDYTFTNLLAYQPFSGDSLFSDLGDEVMLPHPYKKFPLKHFMSIADD